jgi:hypothetical protein
MNVKSIRPADFVHWKSGLWLVGLGLLALLLPPINGSTSTYTAWPPLWLGWTFFSLGALVVLFDVLLRFHKRFSADNPNLEE